MPRGTPSWTPFFDRFLIYFCTQLRPPEPSKSLFFLKVKQCFFGCLSRSDFWWILTDFGNQNGAKLAPKSNPKSLFALKPKNQQNASPLVPNRVRRLRVGTPIQSKIKKNIESKMECLLASIFDRF